MAKSESPLPRASFLVLLALSDRPRHGLAIVEHVEESTKGRVKMGPGTLYGTLHRLMEGGWVEEVDRPSRSVDERRRYYRLTRGGRGLSRGSRASRGPGPGAP